METEEEEGKQRRREEEKGGEKLTLGTSRYQPTGGKEPQRNGLLLSWDMSSKQHNRVCDSWGDPVGRKKTKQKNPPSCTAATKNWNWCYTGKKIGFTFIL